MPTTAVNASANANAQKKQPKMIAKWSGSSSPQSYYSREDTDTVTLTVGEQRRIQCNYANAQRKWRNADEENDARVVVAAKAIVREIARETTATVAPVAPASAAPPRLSSVFWTTPLSIASGEEPVFEAEYPESSVNFTFGVCCDCGVGLCDKSEFICCHTGANGHVNTCNACHNYHMNLHIGGEDGGCN
jgi:flagellar hook protein FlgE